MIPLFNYRQYILRLLKHHPIRTLFLYSLTSELLILLFLFLAFLLTTETILPGFISLRLNLTWYLITILSATSLLVFIGKSAHIRPSQNIPLEKLLLIPSGLWALGIITLSLYHFPWWTILVLLIAISTASVLAWQTFFRNTKGV